ncbi:MAG TPA: heavy metal-binding domain-containing protein [Deinococcales bacterium]|nr:heavy metal-binding domain-containing protein [Deinococcales bacterium]
MNDLTMATTDGLPGFRVTQALGLVSGLAAHSRTPGGRIDSLMQTLAGGDVPTLGQLGDATRLEALERLEASARELGANAVLAVRFTVTEVGVGAREVLAYGTAAVVEPA